ncbi:MAG: Transposase like protein [Verrucomicrobiaceae bacterium]|nr:Transposase like protein [Verrucomicrobiaceae bacterium]
MPAPDSAKAEATFFRPQDELAIHRGNLPHWRQNQVTYFVTARLADSMPQDKLREWRQKRSLWLAAHGLGKLSEVHLLPDDQQHEFHFLFTKQWHAWLDTGFGECHLRLADAREILIKRLLAESSLDAWVIMPNHRHALVSPKDQTLGEVMQSWKGGSSFAINRCLGRSGILWQKEAYDHIVRSEEQLLHYRRYIAENPLKAKPRADEYAVGIGNQVFNSTEEMTK